MASALFMLITLAAIAWFWVDSMRARELASAVCRRTCRRCDVQFLDDTVALVALGITRVDGKLRIRRVYQFEFSDDGRDRLSGIVAISGTHIDMIHLPQPQAKLT